MVLKGKEDRTFKGYATKFSSRGSTVMFDLSKFVSQRYLAIYGDKNIISFYNSFFLLKL